MKYKIVSASLVFLIVLCAGLYFGHPPRDVAAEVRMEFGPRLYCGPLPIKDKEKTYAKIASCNLTGCMRNRSDNIDVSKFESENREGDEIYYFSTYKSGVVGPGEEGFVLRRAGKEIDSLVPNPTCILD